MSFKLSCCSCSREAVGPSSTAPPMIESCCVDRDVTPSRSTPSPACACKGWGGSTRGALTWICSSTNASSWALASHLAFSSPAAAGSISGIQRLDGGGGRRQLLPLDSSRRECCSVEQNVRAKHAHAPAPAGSSMAAAPSWEGARTARLSWIGLDWPWSPAPALALPSHRGRSTAIIHRQKRKGASKKNFVVLLQSVLPAAGRLGGSAPFCGRGMAAGLCVWAARASAGDGIRTRFG